jgi:hypothetical protein
MMVGCAKQRNKEAVARYRKRKLDPSYVPRNTVPARIRRPITVFRSLLKRYWPLLSVSERYKEFEKLLITQAGRCGICDAPLIGKHLESNELNIDHCHTTGVVRGLLCRRCNVGLYNHVDYTTWLNIGRYLKYVAEA